MQLIKFLFFTLTIFGSCHKATIENKVRKIKIIKNSTVDKSQLVLIPEKGRWFYKDKPFNGFAVLYYPNKKIAEKNWLF